VFEEVLEKWKASKELSRREWCWLTRHKHRTDIMGQLPKDLMENVLSRKPIREIAKERSQAKRNDIRKKLLAGETITVPEQRLIAKWKSTKPAWYADLSPLILHSPLGQSGH
jgi:hypothetical protein